MEEKMYIDTRAIESTDAVEIFITATPHPDLPIQKQAEEIFTGIDKLVITFLMTL